MNNIVNPPKNGVCREGCPTQDHKSWGDCVRAARITLTAGETTKGQYS